MSDYTIQQAPFIVPTTDGKRIAEHFGLATDGNSHISIAHMVAPPGWEEPFQTPEFDEYTFVIRGQKQFIIGDEIVVLNVTQIEELLNAVHAAYEARWEVFVAKKTDLDQKGIPVDTTKGWPRRHPTLEDVKPTVPDN